MRANSSSEYATIQAYTEKCGKYATSDSSPTTPAMRFWGWLRDPARGIVIAYASRRYLGDLNGSIFL